MLLISTALMAEANPIIRFFNLKQKVLYKSFAVYENEIIRLVVTGIGKVMAGAGISYLYGISEEEGVDGFLNIGRAAHKSLKIGTPVIASKIKDSSSQKSFHTSLLFDSPILTKAIISTEKPRKEYLEDYCFDMEAFGFFIAASRFVPIELIQSLKIISNNRTNSTSFIANSKIESLIKLNLISIQIIIEKLKEVSKKHKTPTHNKEEVLPFPNDSRFNANEKYKLEEIINNIKILKPSFNIQEEEIKKLKSAKEVFNFLQSKMKNLCKKP